MTLDAQVGSSSSSSSGTSNKYLLMSKTGRSNTRDEIITEYFPLVQRVAKKVVARLPANIEKDDLISAGTIGLIDAISKYNPTKGAFFHSYAELRIKGAMIDDLRKMDWVPRSVRDNEEKRLKLHRLLYIGLGREPKNAELAEELGIRTDEYRTFVENSTPLKTVFFDDLGVLEEYDPRELIENEIEEECDAFTEIMFYNFGSADHKNPEDSFQHYSSINKEDHVFQREIESGLTDALAELTPRERSVVCLYDCDDLNQVEIGQIIGKSEARVSQIRNSGYKALREDPILYQLMRALKGDNGHFKEPERLAA
jgi:RNA polymerase sigma factor FliA